MLKLKREKKPSKALVLSPEYSLEALKPRNSRSTSNRGCQVVSLGYCTKEEQELSMWPYYWEPGRPYVEMKGYKLDCKGTLIHSPGHILKGVQAEPHTFTVFKLGDETRIALNSSQSVFLPLDKAAWQMKERFYQWQLRDGRCTYTIPNSEKFFTWLLQMDREVLSGLVLPVSEIYTNPTKMRVPSLDCTFLRNMRKSKTPLRRSQKKVNSFDNEKLDFEMVQPGRESGERLQTTERALLGKSRGVRAKEDENFKVQSPMKNKVEIPNEINKVEVIKPDNNELGESVVIRKESSKSKKRRRSIPNIWSEEESVKLRELAVGGTDRQHWIEICKQINTEFGGRKTPSQCSQHYHRVVKPQTAKIMRKYLNESEFLENAERLFPSKFEELLEKYKGIQTFGQCLKRLSTNWNIPVSELKNELRMRANEKSILRRLDENEEEEEEEENENIDEEEEEEEEDEDRKKVFFSDAKSRSDVNRDGGNEDLMMENFREFNDEEDEDDEKRSDTASGGTIALEIGKADMGDGNGEEYDGRDGDGNGEEGDEMGEGDEGLLEEKRGDEDDEKRVEKEKGDFLKSYRKSNDNFKKNDKKANPESEIYRSLLKGNNGQFRQQTLKDNELGLEKGEDSPRSGKRNHSQISNNGQNGKKKGGENKRFNDGKQVPRFQLKSSNKRLTVILSHKKDTFVNQDDAQDMES